LTLARTLGHAFSLADVLCFAGCLFSVMRRDAPALKGDAIELAKLAQGMGFSSFFGTGTCFLGQALALLGQAEEAIALMHTGIMARQAVGARCYLAGILASLAEAQAAVGHLEVGLNTIAEALAFVEQSDERHWEAWLHCLRAELLLQHSDEAQAEASLQQAIAVARRQQARSWELRATIRLARLWQAQGRGEEARQVLSAVYGWFSEGFDTPDLRDAQALLLDLS
jgi:predicted ATPase